MQQNQFAPIQGANVRVSYGIAIPHYSVWRCHTLIYAGLSALFFQIYSLTLITPLSLPLIINTELAGRVFIGISIKPVFFIVEYNGTPVIE